MRVTGAVTQVVTQWTLPNLTLTAAILLAFRESVSATCRSCRHERKWRHFFSRTTAIPSETGGQAVIGTMRKKAVVPGTLDASGPGGCGGLPWPSPKCGVFLLPGRPSAVLPPALAPGPDTVKFRELDSFLPSPVHTAPVALQSVVAGSSTVTSPAPCGFTVMSQECCWACPFFAPSPRTRPLREGMVLQGPVAQVELLAELDFEGELGTSRRGRSGRRPSVGR